MPVDEPGTGASGLDGAASVYAAQAGGLRTFTEGMRRTAEYLREAQAALYLSMAPMRDFAERVQEGMSDSDIRLAFGFPPETAAYGPQGAAEDPHGWRTPIRDGMRWSAPETDAEEVPRWLA